MPSKNIFLIYAVIGIVAFCAFANTFGHGFVYDDNRQILRNPSALHGPKGRLLPVFIRRARLLRQA